MLVAIGGTQFLRVSSLLGDADEWVGDELSELNLIKIPSFNVMGDPIQSERWADHMALKVCNKWQFVSRLPEWNGMTREFEEVAWPLK